MSEGRFQAVADLLDDWRANLLSGTPPVLFPVGQGELARIEIGPGLVTLIGGAPGTGKTALVTQLICDALASSPGLRALICNIEMTPAVLLDRQLARLSGIDLSTIRHRRLGPEHAGAVEIGLGDMDRAGGDGRHDPLADVDAMHGYAAAGDQRRRG